MKLGLTALLTCTLTLAACARSAAPASPTGVPAAQAEAALSARQNPYSDQDVTTAQAQVAQAQASLQQAQLALDQTQIAAPVDGTVSDRLVTPGALVGPQTPIVTLIPPSLEVVSSVDDTHLSAIQVGQSARIETPAYPGQTFTGTVASVAPAVDSRTRTAAVRVVPDDPQHQLRPGMQALVTVRIGGASSQNAQTNAGLAEVTGAQ